MNNAQKSIINPKPVLLISSIALIVIVIIIFVSGALSYVLAMNKVTIQSSYSEGGKHYANVKSIKSEDNRTTYVLSDGIKATQSEDLNTSIHIGDKVGYEKFGRYKIIKESFIITHYDAKKDGLNYKITKIAKSKE